METLDIPSAMVGKLIGKGGETIKNLQQSTDTRIQVDHSGEGDNKRVTITGMTRYMVGTHGGLHWRGGGTRGPWKAALKCLGPQLGRFAAGTASLTAS